MSDNRPPKLQASSFGMDQPATIELIETGNDGNPWVQEGSHEEYGPWYRYRVRFNGSEYAFFPAAALQESLYQLHVEDGPLTVETPITICKHSRPDGKGVWWAVGVGGIASQPAAPLDRPIAPTTQQQAASVDVTGGINRMAEEALKVAGKQLAACVGDFTVEDQRGWASTILIAYQKAGAKPADFPDIDF